MIGHITFGMKGIGKRSAGNPPAAFEVAGVGNVTTGAGLRPRPKDLEESPDPTAARQSSTLLLPDPQPQWAPTLAAYRGP